MHKYTALQSFLNNGVKVLKGDSITIAKAEVDEYVRRGLIEESAADAKEPEEHTNETETTQSKKGRKSNHDKH